MIFDKVEMIKVNRSLNDYRLVTEDDLIPNSIIEFIYVGYREKISKEHIIKIVIDKKGILNNKIRLKPLHDERCWYLNRKVFDVDKLLSPDLIKRTGKRDYSVMLIKKVLYKPKPLPIVEKRKIVPLQSLLNKRTA